MSSNDDVLSYKHEFLMFILYGSFYCLCIFIADYLFAWTSVRCASKMHNALLYSILRCGMRFFESTPRGRILNRFGKDLENLETKIPSNLKSSTRLTIIVLSILIVVLINNLSFWHVLLACFVPLFFVYFILQRFYARYALQIKRLEAVSRSPIYSHFAESLNGICTIRAFSKEQSYLKQMQTYLNDNFRIYLADMFANRFSF
jgi:ATP-binding cassette subfamily C (CFTR/MRP) protein 1